MKLLRLFVAVVFKVFYITVLNYLLGPANCSWLVQSKVYNNVDFPSKSTQGLLGMFRRTRGQGSGDQLQLSCTEPAQ
jgi:hypothetical protein